MNKLSNEFISLGVGVAVAIFAFFVLDLGVILSPLLVILAFGGTLFVLSGITPKELIQEETTKASVATGTEKLNIILKLGKATGNPTMYARVTDLGNTIQKILSAIAEDPEKLKQADQFLNYYLDTTIKILTMYIDLSSKNVRDPEIIKSLASVSVTLATLKDAFEKQLVKLVSSDAMDLDAELHLLEQTINMEGLGKSS